ncbi:hypothetical protein Trydic_g22738 [Trypoxylus dichotomus]
MQLTISTVEKVCKVLVLCLSEMLGVALLMFFGCMGCIVDVHPIPTYVFAAFNFGLAVALAIQVVVHISGAHLNPAVSVAAWIMGKLELYLVPFYIIAQIIGGLIGYGFIIALLPDTYTDGLCVTVPNPLVSEVQALFLEIIGTTAMVLLVCSVWDPRNHGLFDSLSLKLGLMIATIFISIGPFSGGGFNPPRSFAPSVYHNVWKSHWVFWLGPMLGGIIAPLLYRFTFLEGLSKVKMGKE